MRRSLSSAAALTAALTAALGAGEQVLVVLAGGAGGADGADGADGALLAAAPAAIVTTYGHLPGLHRRLAAAGPLDLIVDVGGGAHCARRLRREVGALRPCGRLMLQRPRAVGSLAARHLDALLVDLHPLLADRTTIEPARAWGDDRERDVRHLHALAASIAELAVGEDHLELVRSALVSHTVLAEADVDAVVAARPGLGRTTSIHRAPEPAHDAPALRLREYAEVICAPGMVVHTDDLMLPDSYRAPFSRRPISPPLVDWSAHTARTQVPHAVRARYAEAPVRLEGAWFLLDNVLRGHFGHALTEQVSHLWAYAEALRAEPDLRVLLTGHGDGPARWELELLAAFGVDPERVGFADRPVKVERLWAATPGYVIRRYVHPVLAPIYAEAGARLRARAGLDLPAGRRVFVTRTDVKRACVNRAQVESHFADHGFEIVTPETLGLAEQVAVVGGAEVIAGFAGSGLLHLALAAGPRRVLALSNPTYHAWNEQALGRLLGHEVEVLRAPVADPAPGCAGPDRSERGVAGHAMHASYAVALAGPDSVAMSRWLRSL